MVLVFKPKLAWSLALWWSFGLLSHCQIARNLVMANEAVLCWTDLSTGITKQSRNKIQAGGAAGAAAQKERRRLRRDHGNDDDSRCARESRARCRKSC